MVNVCSCFLSCEVTICTYCNSMVFTESTNHLKAYISGIILRPIISILGFFSFVSICCFFTFSFFISLISIFVLFCLGVPHQCRGHQVTIWWCSFRRLCGAKDWNWGLYMPGMDKSSFQGVVCLTFQGVVCLISFSWKDVVWSVLQIIIQYGLILAVAFYLILFQIGPKGLTNSLCYLRASQLFSDPPISFSTSSLSPSEPRPYIPHTLMSCFRWASWT